MIKKQTFIDCIEAIKKQSEIEREFCNSLNSVLDGNFVSIFSETILNSLLKLLEEIMEDNKHSSYDSWISWWMYEKDFGRDKTMTANYKNGKKIKLDTAEDLYKFLIKEMKK